MIYQHPDYPRITIDPDICFGKPCVRGMRMPVSSILDYLSTGISIESLIETFPNLEKEDILQALAFSSMIMQDTYIPLKKAS